MSTFIRDAHVITMDPISGSTPLVRSIRIADGVIVAIGEHLEPEPGDEIIEGRDRLVAPGFVNAHTHSWEMLYKGSLRQPAAGDVDGDVVSDPR